MSGINSKHLDASSPLPEFDNGKINVFSMRFCPFAQRTMLMLLAKKVP